MHGERNLRGFEVVTDPVLIGNLTIGQSNVYGNKIGPGYEFRDTADFSGAARAAAEEAHDYTITDAALCIDERGMIQLGDVTDPDTLKRVVAPRLPGGTYLAATKAATAANIAVVRDAKTFEEAYDIVAGLLDRAGYKDAGHEECGAETNAALSVEEQVDAETAFATVSAVGFAKPDERGAFDTLEANKRQLVSRGFYVGYDPKAHKERVQRTSPQYFATLQTAPDAVHGHHGSGLLVLDKGKGLTNNHALTAERKLFVYTADFARKLANELGGSDEERRMTELAFHGDLIDVGNTLFAKPEGEPGQPGYYPGMAVLKA